jgi:hypothetical protein
VAYDEFPAVGIRYATRTPSGWTTKLVDSGQRWDPSLVLDADGELSPLNVSHVERF